MTHKFHPKDAEATLFAALIDAAARQGWDKPILEDIERKPFTYKRLVLASLVLGAKLAEGTRPGEAVGLLLPNVSALPIAIFGLNAFGRACALLNFSAGARNVEAAARTAPVRRIVTSRRFVEMAKLEETVAALSAIRTDRGDPVEIVYLEDVRKGIGSLDKAKGAARFALARAAGWRTGAAPHDVAVILFTSGTEGSPKGVALTNANIVANARQVIAFAYEILDETNAIFNPLPIFHSFGLTAGTVMPFLKGLKSFLYPSPLHYKQVASLLRDTQAQLLLATDTFLQGYVRAGDPNDLVNLKYVVLGAERVKEQTRALCGSLGLKAHLLEGYGVTETSPVVSVNLPSENRLGSVGRPLPGMEFRFEDVEGITDGGRLFIRGPNVMAGYILRDRPSVVAPLPGGWHDTGDIAAMDGDGFIAIKGRAKRFAKIGGEMVSLAAVEQLAADLWPESQSVVVAVPDPRKGEQLILITERTDAGREALLGHARVKRFPELWTPKAIMVVETVPMLGSGKVDYAAVRELANSARAAAV